MVPKLTKSPRIGSFRFKTSLFSSSCAYHATAERQPNDARRLRRPVRVYPENGKIGLTLGSAALSGRRGRRCADVYAILDGKRTVSGCPASSVHNGVAAVCRWGRRTKGSSRVTVL